MKRKHNTSRTPSHWILGFNTKWAYRAIWIKGQGSACVQSNLRQKFASGGHSPSVSVYMLGLYQYRQSCAGRNYFMDKINTYTYITHLTPLRTSNYCAHNYNYNFARSNSFCSAFAEDVLYGMEICHVFRVLLINIHYSQPNHFTQCRVVRPQRHRFVIATALVLNIYKGIFLA